MGPNTYYVSRLNCLGKFPILDVYVIYLVDITLWSSIYNNVSLRVILKLLQKKYILELFSGCPCRFFYIYKFHLC